MVLAFVNGLQLEIPKFRLRGFGLGLVFVGAGDDHPDGAVRPDFDSLSTLLLRCASGAGDIGEGEAGCRPAHL